MKTIIEVEHPNGTTVQMVQYSGPNVCLNGTTDFSIIEPEQSAGGEGETIDAIAKIRKAVGEVRFIAPARMEVALLLQRHDALQSEIATLRKHNEELIFSVAAVLKCWYEDAGDVVRMTPKMDHLKLVRRRIEDATPLPEGDKK